jgi:hypothetical protein
MVHIRSEILTVVTTRINIFWKFFSYLSILANIMVILRASRCSIPLSTSAYFFILCLLFFSEDGGSMYLRMVDKSLIFYSPIHVNFSIPLRSLHVCFHICYHYNLIDYPTPWSRILPFFRIRQSFS